MLHIQFRAVYKSVYEYKHVDQAEQADDSGCELDKMALFLPEEFAVASGLDLDLTLLLSVGSLGMRISRRFNKFKHNCQL